MNEKAMQMIASGNMSVTDLETGIKFAKYLLAEGYDPSKAFAIFLEELKKIEHGADWHPAVERAVSRMRAGEARVS